jgi:hypothetical protein
MPSSLITTDTSGYEITNPKARPSSSNFPSAFKLKAKSNKETYSPLSLRERERVRGRRTLI